MCEDTPDGKKLLGKLTAETSEGPEPEAETLVWKDLLNGYADESAMRKFGIPDSALRCVILFRLMQDIYSPKGWNVVKPDLPIHFIAGAQDPCIINLKKFSKAVSFLRNCGYREVTSKVYPMMRHEILNENGREEVWSDVRALLDGWLAR